MNTTTIDEPTSSTIAGAPDDAVTTAHRPLKWRKVAFWSSMISLPAAVAVLGSRRSKLVGGVAGGLTALALAGLRWQFQRWFSAEPTYEVEDQVGPLEIRRYAAHVEARTRILTDDHDKALETGFQRLAAYIFGGNQRKETLEMATPVTTRDGDSADQAAQTIDAKNGEKLEMTSPVINQRSGMGHVMAFVMPPGRDLGSLPEPNDARVELAEVPERRVAVLSYRGRYTADSVKRHQDELLEAAREAGLHVVGNPLFAGFDPPNTIPWLRRNEVWVEIS
jgi:hypothetical protein